jgi:hypothetical protein
MSALPVLIIIGVIIFVVIGMGSGRRGRSIRAGGPTLVLRKFDVDESMQDGILVEIIGRASGPTAWLLTVLGFDAETRLKVTEKEFSFKSSSFWGQIIQIAPLPNISSTHCGYSKPIGYLIISGIFVIDYVISIITGAGYPFNDNNGILIVKLIIGGLFMLLYWLSKKMTISFETSGGMVMGLTFKRSVIENVAVDIEKARQAIEIINKNVIKSHCRK